MSKWLINAFTELKSFLANPLAAPILEKTITENVNINDNLVFDFKSLNYISKAGFQVLVKTKEKMSDGFMTIKNVCDEIIKELEVNGFIDDFIIE